jgi:hypothetical protein
MPNTHSKAVPNRRNGSAANSSPATQTKSDLVPLPEPVREWVQEQPWLMVGAAAGIGLAVGAAGRRSRLGGGLGQMLASTASGAAVRVAINTLVQWLEPKLEGRR